MRRQWVGAIVAIAALALAPWPAPAQSDSLFVATGSPRRCSGGANIGCACEGDGACVGGTCEPVKLRGRGIMTIIVDAAITDYEETPITHAPGPKPTDPPALVERRAVTVLIDLKARGRKRLLSETYQLPGDTETINGTTLLGFAENVVASKGDRTLVFRPQGVLEEKLLCLFDPAEGGGELVLFGAKIDLPAEDPGASPRATVVRLKVGIAFAGPSCLATPVASPTGTPPSTPTANATASAAATTRASPTPMPATASATPPTSVATPSATKTASPSAFATQTVALLPTASSTPSRTAAATSATPLPTTPTPHATATSTQVRTGTPPATLTPVPTRTVSALPSETNTPAASPTGTSSPVPILTPTPVGVPAVALEDRTISLSSRGRDTYVRCALTNPTTEDLGRIPYTASFTVEPADGQVVVTTPEIQGRPVVNAGYKDYVRVGITTSPDAPRGEHRVIGVFRFSPSCSSGGLAADRNQRDSAREHRVASMLHERRRE